MKIHNKVLVAPNVAKLARKLTEKSQVGLVIEGFRNLSFLSKMCFGLDCLPALTLLVKKDFSAGVFLLIMLDYYSSDKSAVKILVHNQMFDMSMIFDRKELVELMQNFCKKKNLSLGFLTANKNRSVKFLSFCNLDNRNIKISSYNKELCLIEL